MIDQLPDLEPEESKIQFFHQDLDWSLTNQESTSDWLIRVAEKEGKSIHQLSIIFMSDDDLLEMNRQYLDHDYYTDIITFPLNQEPLLAELYISIDRVKDNAKTRNIPFLQELSRVMVHGLLHLCGYGDKTEEEIKLMREKEDFYME